MTTHRYWIAVNGSGCALSITPMIDAETVPTAQQMWGFPTLEEAQSAQHIVLTAPIPDVTAFLQGLEPDIKSGRVIYKRPANPGPQTRGRTSWMDMARGQVPDGMRELSASLAAVADARDPLPPNKEQLRRIRQMAERRRKDAH